MCMEPLALWARVHCMHCALGRSWHASAVPAVRHDNKTRQQDVAPPRPAPPLSPQVPESFSLERAYILFSTMGLRHLVITDEHNRVRGMVTRKVRAALISFRAVPLKPYLLFTVPQLHFGAGGASYR